MRHALWTVALSLGAWALAGCGLGGEALSPEAPAFEPKDQTKCAVRKSQDKPLIVEWPSADRVELESEMKDGVVVVRYDGCEMRLLSQCDAPGRYHYTAVTPKHDTVVIDDADELYTAIPVGAARFEGKLATAGQLNVDMAMVGRFRASEDQTTPEQLRGACHGATHIISGMTVGAFEFYAGARAEAGVSGEVLAFEGGAGAKARRETLTTDGDRAACDQPSPDGPPQGCAAILRVEVSPLTWRAATQCPSGTQWNGALCVASQVTCPAGATWDGRRCVVEQVAHPRPVATTQPACPAGMRWDGKACANALLELNDDCKGEEACVMHCEHGRLAACWKAAQNYHYGWDRVARDWKKTLQYATMSCDGGVIEACKIAAEVQQRNDQPSKALASLRRGCDGGSKESCKSLAWTLRHGVGGLAVDLPGAVVILRRLCAEGDGNACADLQELGYR